MMPKILFVRGGLGNRLRAIESILIDSEKFTTVVWPVDADCYMKAEDYFDFDKSKVKIRYIPGFLGFLLNSFQFICSKFSKQYFPRNFRSPPKTGIFLSTPHSCWVGERRFKFVRFRSDIECILNSQLKNLSLTGKYTVFYMRGKDNFRAIKSTDYRSLLQTIDVIDDVKLGISDDLSFRMILGSYGCKLLTDGDTQRSSYEGMKQAVADLYIMSLAKSIHSSNYSSFAELGYSLGDEVVLHTYELSGTNFN